jgi:hypothetical protein
MYSKEPLGNQNKRIAKRIEQMEAKDEDGSNERKDLCASCIFGGILGISALAICYLAFMTAVAYAIP